MKTSREEKRDLDEVKVKAHEVIDKSRAFILVSANVLKDHEIQVCMGLTANIKVLSRLGIALDKTQDELKKTVVEGMVEMVKDYMGNGCQGDCDECEE